MMQPFTFFISYRRLDTAPVALLLKHEIEKRLQFVRVFVDVESLEVGEDFAKRISLSIQEAQATIVLIGEKWMPRAGVVTTSRATARDKKEKKTDYVTYEISASLQLPVQAALGGKRRADSSRRVIVPIFINMEKDFSQFEIPAEIAPISTLNAERLDYGNWPDAIGPLIEKLSVRLNLKEQPDGDRYPEKDVTKSMTRPVEDRELSQILGYKYFDGWYLDNFGQSDVRYLVKTFSFEGFGKAAEFMRLVSDHCKILDHHPEWRNVFDHVTVALTTWDARRQVTIYDLNLALFINRTAEVVKSRE